MSPVEKSENFESDFRRSSPAYVFSAFVAGLINHQAGSFPKPWDEITHLSIPMIALISGWSAGIVTLRVNEFLNDKRRIELRNCKHAIDQLTLVIGRLREANPSDPNILTLQNALASAYVEWGGLLGQDRPIPLRALQPVRKTRSIKSSPRPNPVVPAENASQSQMP
jgi:hypothetical protein